MADPINKTMDRDDLYLPAAMQLRSELNGLVPWLQERGARISAWYGLFDLHQHPQRDELANRGYAYAPLEDAVDDANFPWFLYWEICWLVLNTQFKPGERVLDLGGSSSLFSYYLASKGLEVVTVDLQQALVENGNRTAAITGWNLKNYVMDMNKLAFEQQFHHITSVCVYEHIPMYDRVSINKKIKELLLPGGTFSITFDYRNPSAFARIGSPDAVHEQFIEPSGLRPRGNAVFADNGKNYLLHPFYHKPALWGYKLSAIRRKDFDARELFRLKQEADYTFGALFLQKEQAE